MKKGQIAEGKVEKILFPNKGVVTAEGQPVVVKNALPGQKIRFCISKARNGRLEGRLLEVLERGQTERQPACENFGQCGGCLYLSLPYEEQLRIKETQVKEILDQAVLGAYVFEGILPSPRPYGYRNKMEFSFGDAYKDGPLSLGMHKRGSFYDVVTADSCQIVDEDYRKILMATLGYFREKGTPYFHKMTHRGFLRHLLVRKGTKSGEILIDLVTTSQEGNWSEEEKGEFAKLLLKLELQGTIAGILHTVNDSLSDVVKNDGTRILYGKDHFYEALLGLRFRITPFSFFQTNSLGAETLYEKVREYVGDAARGRTVFDLYSGTGTIAQMLAPVAKKVTGVEIVEEAVAAARENARTNGLSNCEFLAGDVLKVIDEITDKPDLIVLDPPRDGIHPKALKKIIDFGVERIVYISCKPTSLARDLAALQAGGYRAEKAVAVDMFPWTGNVESLMELKKVL